MVITGYAAMSCRVIESLLSTGCPGGGKNHERLPPDAAGHERVICRLGPQRSQRDRCPSLSEIVLNDLNIAIEHGDLEQRISPSNRLAQFEPAAG